MTSPQFLHPRLLDAPPATLAAYERATDTDKVVMHTFLEAVDEMLQATDGVQQSFVMLLGTMDTPVPENLKVGTEGVAQALGELEEARSRWTVAVEAMKSLSRDLKDPFSGFLEIVHEAQKNIQIQG